MSFLAKYKTDKVAEVKGVWVEMDANVSVLVARLNNDNAREHRRTLEKPYRNFPEIPESVSVGILRKVVAKHVLLGWKGMTDVDGKTALEYSPEVAEKLFAEYPDFFNDIVTLAAARETFQAEAVEAVKNA